MSNLFKKVTSTVGVIAVAVSSVSSTLTVQAASTFSPYADALATAGIIGKQSSEAGYRLGDSVTRAEMAKIAVNIKGAEVKEVTGKVFSDVNASLGDLAKYIEAAANAGLVSKTNAKFRPLDLVTRAEALKMLLNAKGVAPTTEDQGFKDIASTGDLAGYINAAAKAGYINKGTSFNPNNTATRGESFKIASNAAQLTTSAVETTGGDDLDLGSLFGDTTATGTTATGTTTTTTGAVVPPAAAGTLEVSLNPTATIPAGTTLPVAAGITVGKIDLTAGSADISVTSIKLLSKGVGARTDLAGVALFSNGAKIAKSKTVSSEDIVDLNLMNTLVVKAGSTVTVDIVVSTASAAGEHFFQVAKDGVVSSAATVAGTFPLSTSLFKTSTTSAGTLTFATDGTLANAKLGTIGATLQKFKISTDSTEDVTVKSFTFKKDSSSTAQDSDVANLALFMNGAQVATGTLVNKYVTFKFDKTIEKNKSDVKFEIRGDVVGGAGKTLALVIDSTTDITAVGSKYAYGANVSGTATITNSVTLNAGAVSLVKVDATADKVMKNKKDVILGKIKVTANSGKNVELSTLKFTIDTTLDSAVGAATAFGEIENLEVFNENTNQVYDLSYVSGNGSKVYSNTDMGLILQNGVEYTLTVRADTKTSAVDGDYIVKIANATGGDVVMKEVANDTTISDITPNAVSLKKVAVQVSSFTMTQNALSSALSAVIGTSDVELIDFNVKANDTSDLKVKELKIADEAASTMDNTLVSGFKLYQVTSTGNVLVKSIGTSDLSSQEATFRDLTIMVAKNTTARFKVMTSLVKDTGNDTKTIKVRVSGYSLEDADGVATYDTTVDVNSDGVIPAATAGALSARTLTVNSTGTATVAIDTNDSAANKDKNVLAGTTSDFVAAYKITANKEGVKIKDLTVTFDANISSSVSSVVLYKGDKVTEIARQTASAAAVAFTSIPSYVVAEGTEYMYVKLVTNKIGKDQAGVMVTGKYITSLAISNAEGAASGDAITVTTETTDSKLFSIVPVRVSNVTFVSSYGSESVTSSLVNGQNTVGIIAVTADTTTNTTSSGSILKTEIEDLLVNVSTDAPSYDATGTGGHVTALTVQRIGGVTSATTVARGDGNALANADVLGTTNINLVRGVALGADEEIAAGTTAYYVVKANFSGLSSTRNEYIQLNLASLDSGNVEYSSDNSDDSETYDNTDNVTALNLGVTSVSGPSIASKY